MTAFAGRLLVKTLGEFLIEQLRGEIENQGHSLTGKLAKSLEVKVRRTSDSISLDFYFEKYGKFVNRGVDAKVIPFGGKKRRNKGGTSKYIQGLISFVKKRFGYSKKRAERVAFAIAAKHAKEGMPTANSYKYSKNGRRTGWIDKTLELQEEQINAIIEDWVGANVEIVFENYVKLAA